MIEKKIDIQKILINEEDTKTAKKRKKQKGKKQMEEQITEYEREIDKER